MFLAAALAFTLLSAHSYRVRFPLPDATVGSGWGVNIRFTELQPGDLDAIAAAGFKWVRTDFDWSNIEREKGRYDFQAYDAFLHDLEAHHLRALFTLDSVNDIYPAYDAKSGISYDSMNACGRFSGAAAKRFRHRGVIWEIGNEWNLGSGKTRPDPIEYRNLSATIGGSISEACSDEWQIGPGTSGFDWTYITTGLIACFGSGAIGFLDGISVHPSPDLAPESEYPDWNQLRNFVSAESGIRHLCLISSGWGYSSVSGQVSEEQQANYAVRSYFVNLANGVNLSIYDDWRDNGPSPNHPANHLGVVSQDGSPKAAYRLIKQVTTDLAGYHFKGRRLNSNPNVNVYVFSRGKATKVYAWITAGDPQSVSIPPEAPKVTLSQQPKLIATRN